MASEARPSATAAPAGDTSDQLITEKQRHPTQDDDVFEPYRTEGKVVDVETLSPAVGPDEVLLVIEDLAQGGLAMAENGGESVTRSDEEPPAITEAVSSPVAEGDHVAKLDTLWHSLSDRCQVT